MPSTKQPNAKRRLFADEPHDEAPASEAAIVAENDSTPPPAVVLGTPLKKRRVEASGPFFSPRKGKVVTPEKEDEVESPLPASTQPFARTKKDEPYIPTYVHKNISYQREGEGSLDDMTRRVFDLVQAHFTIPDDFEQSRSFGPLSGTSFEERVVRAYSLSLLEPRGGEESEIVKICTHCATMGHKRQDCPDLL